MVTCIVLKGMHKVSIDANEKFQLNGHKLSIKDIPFVRYRFEKFGDEEFEYIDKMRKVFKYSCHMIEINICDNVTEILEKAEERESIISYVYVPITDADLVSGLSEDVIKNLEDASDYQLDRVMIKDNCSSLFLVDANKIRQQIKDATGLNTKDIGICSSPLSFNGEACLTAVKARELSAEYAESDEAALPSLNHECMNTCGCIRYMVIDKDIVGMISKNTGSSKKSSSGAKKGSKLKVFRALPNSKGNL